MHRILVPASNLFLIIIMTVASAGAETDDQLFQKALNLEKEGFWEESAKTWEQLRQSNPGKPLQTFSALKLSSVFLKLAQPFKAVEMLTDVADSQPDHFDVQFHLGNAQAKIKSYPEAIAAFKKAVELRPGEGLGNVALALAYFGNRQSDAARKQLQKAKKIFKKKKNISWYRDARIMAHQIKGFAKYPPNFSSLWLKNSLALVRNTYEKTVFDFEDMKK